jgi:hypothetical protein
VPFLGCPKLPLKLPPEKTEEVDVAIFALPFVSIAAGVALAIAFDERREPLDECPYCAAHVEGYPLACPACHKVLGRRRT